MSRTLLEEWYNRVERVSLLCSSTSIHNNRGQWDPLANQLITAIKFEFSTRMVDQKFILSRPRSQPAKHSSLQELKNGHYTGRPRFWFARTSDNTLKFYPQYRPLRLQTHPHYYLSSVCLQGQFFVQDLWVRVSHFQVNTWPKPTWRSSWAIVKSTFAPLPTYCLSIPPVKPLISHRLEPSRLSVPRILKPATLKIQTNTHISHIVALATVFHIIQP